MDPLITFLEKEVKVQQQKLLHGCNSDWRKISFLDRNNQGKTNPKARMQQSSHHTWQSSSNSTYDAEIQSECFICGETDHITTNGP